MSENVAILDAGQVEELRPLLEGRQVVVSFVPAWTRRRC